MEAWGLTLEGFSHALTWALSYLHDSVKELNFASGGVLLDGPSFRNSSTQLDVLFLKGLKFFVNTPPCVRPSPFSSPSPP